MTLVGVVMGALAPAAPEVVPDEVLSIVVEAPAASVASSTVVEAPAASVASSTVVPAPPVQIPMVEARGLEVLAALPISVESLGFTISFHERAQPGGLLWPDRAHIEIFVSPGQPDSLLRHIVAHEIGHAVDLRMNSLADHDAWRAARGIPSDIDWWAAPYASDFDTPGGDFAECFASWLAGGTSRSVWGSCAGTESLMARLAAG